MAKEELLKTADVVSIHMVLSARTKGLIGAAELALMKPSARLINTSRGPLVVEAALVDALSNRQISGAAIDVFDIEPLPGTTPIDARKTCLLRLISDMPRVVFTSAFIETASRTSARGLTKDDHRGMRSSISQCRTEEQDRGIGRSAEGANRLLVRSIIQWQATIATDDATKDT